MKTGAVLICLMALLAVSSARPQIGGGNANAGAFGFQTPTSSHLNLNTNANTFTHSNGGVVTSNSFGVASGVLVNTPNGSHSNLNTNAFHNSQG